jgi:hypothetical protein
MKWLKKSAVTVVGIALVAGGIALLVLPGPGILLVAAGLAVLATEYVWAQRLVGKAKESAKKAQKEAVASPWRTGGTVAFALGSIAVGVLMLVIDDVSWPALDSMADSVWGPVTGSVLILTALVLLTTTVVAWRSEHREESTWFD